MFLFFSLNQNYPKNAKININHTFNFINNQKLRIENYGTTSWILSIEVWQFWGCLLVHTESSLFTSHLALTLRKNVIICIFRYKITYIMAFLKIFWILWLIKTNHTDVLLCDASEMLELRKKSEERCCSLP